MMLTVIGLLNWDQKAFDLLQLPDGAIKQVAIDNICLTCGELGLVYSDPEVFREMVGIWSQVRYYAWKTLWATTQLDYNPIENFDRYEDFSEDRDSEASGTGTSSGQRAQKVRGFDSNTLVDKDTASDNGESSSSSTGKERLKHTSHMHGTIGVVTSQDMIKKERDIANFSFYDVIAEEFKQRFCVLVY